MQYDNRYRLLVFGMWASMVASAASIIGWLVQRDDPIILFGSGSDIATLTDITDLVKGLTLIVLAIGYFRWQHRAVKIRQDMDQFFCTPAWSIAYWFLPIVSLYYPYRVVSAIVETVPTDKVLHLKFWWALFLGNSFAGTAILFQAGGADAPYGMVEAILDGSWIAAGFLFIPIFKAIAPADRPESMVAHVFA